jgi:hypothetical protein
MMTNKNEKYLASLDIRGMQIKTTWIVHLNPVRMTVIKKTTNAGEDREHR